MQGFYEDPRFNVIDVSNQEKPEGYWLFTNGPINIDEGVPGRIINF